MAKELNTNAKREHAQQVRCESVKGRRLVTKAMLIAAASLGVGRALQGATETWTPGGASGGAGTWDNVTDNWNGATATWSNGNNGTFGGVGGAVTVASGGISLGNATLSSEGYSFTGGTITLTTAATPGFTIPNGTAAGTTTISAPLAGSAGAEFVGDGISSASFSIGSDNSYQGTTIISECTFYMPTLTVGGTSTANNSPVGESGMISLGYSTSNTAAIYTGAGASTDRQWEFTGSGGGIFLYNDGSGSLSFTNTGVADGVGVSSPTVRNMVFAGTYTAAANTFAEQIVDVGTGTGNNTNVKINSATWDLTGSNTYTGGTNVASGTANLEIGNASALGTGSLTYTANGAVTGVAAVTVTTPILINGTYSARLIGGVSGAPSTATTFNYGGLISDTGTGTLVASTLSSSTYGPLELSNDSNSFTNFSTGYGFVEFTSVANGGTVSALGAGSTPYFIGNSSSAVTFRYIGSNNDSTTRAINWNGTSGSLYLDASGGGTVQYLATSAIRTGVGASTLNLDGTNTGNNVLLQPISDSSSGTTTLSKNATTTNAPDTGNWTLGGSSTYTGATIVNGGTLTIDAGDYAGASIAGSTSISIGAAGTLHLLNLTASGDQSMLSSNAAVSVSTGSAIALDLNGYSQAVGAFSVNGIQQAAGQYGSAAYFGSNDGLTDEQIADEAFFTGDGALNAAPEPGSVSMLGLGACGLLARRRRRLSASQRDTAEI